MSEPATDRPSRAPVCSLGALACMAVILAVFAFFTTPEGQSFNERVFGRYYTAGMILAFAVYGLGGVGLFGLGVVLAATAWLRKEKPAWLRNLAVGVFHFLVSALRLPFFRHGTAMVVRATSNTS